MGGRRTPMEEKEGAQAPINVRRLFADPDLVRVSLRAGVDGFGWLCRVEHRASLISVENWGLSAKAAVRSAMQDAVSVDMPGVDIREGVEVATWPAFEDVPSAMCGCPAMVVYGYGGVNCSVHGWQE